MNILDDIKIQVTSDKGEQDDLDLPQLRDLIKQIEFLKEYAQIMLLKKEIQQRHKAQLEELQTSLDKLNAKKPHLKRL